MSVMMALGALLSLSLLALSSSAARSTRHEPILSQIQRDFQAPPPPPPTSPSSFQYNPVARPEAMVTAGNARFTVLTPWVIRCEFQLQQQFIDAPTLVFVNRYLPAPTFSSTSNATHTIIDTGYVRVEYVTSSTRSFSPENIRITATFPDDPFQPPSKMLTSTWSGVNHQEFKDINFGTVRTLDGTNGAQDIELDCQDNERSDLHCTYGVHGRQGYALIDDSQQPQLDNNKWPWMVGATFGGQTNASCFFTDTALKRDCASADRSIRADECQARGCCWDSSSVTDVGTPFCFHYRDQQQDLYFFGHGHNYRQAMLDFTRLSGPIPLPPRYAFGNFFSRWFAYASYDEKDVVAQYQQHDIPLDVLISDMDWHKVFYKQANAGVVDQSGNSLGWTGFSWNPPLFDTPEAYLSWCSSYGLHKAVNCHPAAGIQPFEDTYLAVARALDQKNFSAYIPFTPTDKRFVTAWANITLRAVEEAGVDLWWLDWQQGEDLLKFYHIFANPTLWLNYIFFTNPYHWHTNNRRPVLLHRWGGLSNHRYPVGFSGDVQTSWKSLAYQPYFTAQASNVGFVHWSHDLGSFGGRPNPELYVRWLQWGQFSPIFRTHCSKSGENNRYPWTFDDSPQQIVYNALRKASKMRQSLVPYLYTHARRAFDTGLGVMLPLYYDYPALDQAYNNPHEYLFGEAMLIAPITTPISNQTLGLVNTTVWFPPGDTWVNIFTGDVHQVASDQGLYVERNWTISEMPAYAKAGSILPMLPDSVPAIGSAERNVTTLKLLVVVGGVRNGRGTFYDDSGDSADYVSTGTHAWTNFTYSVSDSFDQLNLTIGMASNNFTRQLRSRSYEIHLRGTLPATFVNVTGLPTLPFQRYLGLPLPSPEDGAQVNHYSYDGSTLTTVIYIRQALLVNQTWIITVGFSGALNHPALLTSTGFSGTLARWRAAKVTLDYQWGTNNTVYQDDYPSLMQAAQRGEILTNRPAMAQQILTSWSSLIQTGCSEVKSNITNLDLGIQAELLAQLC